jgi:hypothetical protein
LVADPSKKDYPSALREQHRLLNLISSQEIDKAPFAWPQTDSMSSFQYFRGQSKSHFVAALNSTAGGMGQLGPGFSYM